MRANTKDLLKAFSEISGALSTRSSLLILMSVKLEAKCREIKIHASNLDCWATATVECEGELEPICAPSRNLLDLLNRSAESVEITASNGRLKISSTAFVADMPTIKAEEFPPFPDEKAKAIGLSCADLADCIDAVRWACADETDSRVWAQTVQVKCTAKAMVCHGCNGKMAGRVERPLISADCEFSLPAKSCSLLASALRCDGAEFSCSQNHAISISSQLAVAVRLMDCPYVDVGEKIMNGNFDEIGMVGKSALLPHLETIGVIQTDRFFATECQFSDKGLSLCFRGENDFDATVAGEFAPTKSSFDSKLARAALKSCPQESVKIRYSMPITMFDCGEYRAAFCGLTDKNK